jgi:hypothetical protein
MYHGIFVQIDLAKCMGFSYEPYSEADSEAALISMEDAEKALIALDNIRLDPPQGAFTATVERGHLKPQIVPSNVADIGTILAYHISDDNFIDVFTDGSAKTTPLYMAIMKNDANSRFSWTTTFTNIQKRYEENKKGMPKKEEPVKNEDADVKKISDSFAAVFGSTLICYKAEGLVCARMKELSQINEDVMKKFAKAIGKNVLFIHTSQYESYVKKLDKTAFKNFEFVFVSQNESSSFTPVSTSGFRDQVCLGFYIDNCYAPLLNAGEKESPLSKYDVVMADQKTGVIFCVRKSNFVYLLAGMRSTNSMKVEYYDRMLKEVARRWDNDISDEELEKIDIEYSMKLSECDKGEYIKFAVSSANTYVKKIKAALTEGIKEIGELQRQLAEKMKVYNQYTEIIENYDEEKHTRQLGDKAMEAYDAVLALPQVKSMFIKDGRVNVFTSDIVVVDERSKKKHNIGCFHIRLNMLLDTYDTNESIFIKNLKSPLVGGYSGVQEAPHIFNGGHMCHGNLTNTVIECYANRDIYGLISAVIFFLEAANTADYAGQHISKWPEYKEEEPKPKKPTKVKDETDDELSAVLATTVRG